LVEDEPQVMRFLRATLPAHGYRMLEAASGGQALVEARRASRTWCCST
jgi:two-component system KDP operon response regulator KdpE